VFYYIFIFANCGEPYDGKLSRTVRERIFKILF